MGLNIIVVSFGFVCILVSLETSYVFVVLGVLDDIVHSSIRFGLGRFNIEEEVDYIVEQVVVVVN